MRTDLTRVLDVVLCPSATCCWTADKSAPYILAIYMTRSQPNMAAAAGDPFSSTRQASKKEELREERQPMCACAALRTTLHKHKRAKCEGSEANSGYVCLLSATSHNADGHGVA
eukprot:364092-Chlamydomonas_euryale.AAC.4